MYIKSVGVAFGYRARLGCRFPRLRRKHRESNEAQSARARTDTAEAAVVPYSEFAQTAFGIFPLRVSVPS